jgi:hypothetical protein
MNPTHEVISDFLDGEAFDPRALGDALADPAGRDLLIDCVILRYAAQAGDAVVTTQRPARPRVSRVLFAAAALFVALIGGYQLGHRRVEPTSTTPPVATRVVEVDWQAVNEERVR